MKTIYWVIITVVVVAIIATVLTKVAIKKQWFMSDKAKFKTTGLADAAKQNENQVVADTIGMISDLDQNIVETQTKTSPNNLTLTNRPPANVVDTGYDLNASMLMS